MNVRRLLTWSMYARLLAAGFLLCAAAGLMDHADHGVLRVLVFLLGLFAAFSAWKAKSPLWTILLAAGAIAFNPIMRAHATRTVWVVMDLVVAGLFAVSVFALSEPDGDARP